MIRLEGSCHCGAVKFVVQSDYVYPYQRCYCSICRKTQGGGGYAINLSGEKKSLRVRGKKNLQVYRAKMGQGRLSSGERNFCKHCGSALWLYDPKWPELIHPFASAIDSRLPKPPESTHLMLSAKPEWVVPQFGARDKKYARYPKESIAEWHERTGLQGRR